MKNENLINKQHWNRIGSKYNINWQNFAKSELSKKEISFVSKHFIKDNYSNILDIGCGTGRIIQSYLQQDNVKRKMIKIFGIDLSDSMISVCKKKFKNYPNVKIKKCDISKEKKIINQFDFISAIRVLKYNRNWVQIIKKISRSLKKDGCFVFTMMNDRSIDRFALYPIKIYKTNENEIKKILQVNGLSVIEITSFSKIPDIFYNVLGNNWFLSNCILSIERVLEYIFGKLFLGRIFFISAKKK